MVQKHPGADCDNCSLLRRPFVADKPGRENEIMFVGEAPTENDTTAGEPLSGASGKLLNQILTHYGIDRRDVYITNTVMCRPAPNTSPTKNDIKCCSHRLHKTIQTISPQWVVPMGAVAAKEVMMTNTGVKDLRVGPAKDYPVGTDTGIKVIPTVSPGMVLRSADNFPSFANDIGKIYDTHRLRWAEPQYKVVDSDSADDLKHLGYFADSKSPLVVDIEVGVDKDQFGTHPERYDFLCIGLADGSNPITIVGRSALKSFAVRELLKRILLRPLICHNGKFDIAGVRQIQPLATLWFDTMLASYALDERTGIHSLEHLSQEILGAPSWKNMIKPHVKNGNYASVPPDLLYRYNAYDMWCTYLLYRHFADKLLKRNLGGLHDFLVASSMQLMELELEGMLVDTEYLAQLDKDLQEEGDVYELLFRQQYNLVNPRSWQQVQKVFATLGHPVKSTAEDAITEIFADRMRVTGARAVELLEEPAFAATYKDEVCRFIHILLEYRGLAKLYGTYVKGIRERLYNGRIYPNLRLHTTVTGRLSSADPNMQNIPRGGKIKRLFVPAPGYSYVQCDYRAAELRVVGVLSRCDYLRGVLNDPKRDIHGEVAATYYGSSFTSEQRTNCKRVVFGSTYGAEAPRVAQILGISIVNAGKFLDGFFGLMPEVVAWREDLKQQILAGKDLTTFTGRHRRHWLISNMNQKDIIKEGYAYIPQSTASDITLLSANALRSMGYHVKMLVHDSILVECPTEDTAQVAFEMQRVMTETAQTKFDDFIDFTTEAEVGDSWAFGKAA